MPRLLTQTRRLPHSISRINRILRRFTAYVERLNSIAKEYDNTPESFVVGSEAENDDEDASDIDLIDHNKRRQIINRKPRKQKSGKKKTGPDSNLVSNLGP